MTESEKDLIVLSDAEKAFKAFSPWIGLVAYGVGMYYLLERGQEIPWYIFFIAGGLMGLGNLLIAIKSAGLGK